MKYYKLGAKNGAKASLHFKFDCHLIQHIPQIWGQRELYASNAHETLNFIHFREKLFIAHMFAVHNFANDNNNNNNK